MSNLRLLDPSFDSFENALRRFFPPSVFDAFMSAPSKGAFFTREIRPSYRSAKR